MIYKYISQLRYYVMIGIGDRPFIVEFIVLAASLVLIFSNTIDYYWYMSIITLAMTLIGIIYFDRLFSDTFEDEKMEILLANSESEVILFVMRFFSSVLFISMFSLLYIIIGTLLNIDVGILHFGILVLISCYFGSLTLFFAIPFGELLNGILICSFYILLEVITKGSITGNFYCYSVINSEFSNYIYVFGIGTVVLFVYNYFCVYTGNE